MTSYPTNRRLTALYTGWLQQVIWCNEFDSVLFLVKSFWKRGRRLHREKLDALQRVFLSLSSSEVVTSALICCSRLRLISISTWHVLKSTLLLPSKCCRNVSSVFVQCPGCWISLLWCFLSRRLQEKLPGAVKRSKTEWSPSPKPSTTSPSSSCPSPYLPSLIRLPGLTPPPHTVHHQHPTTLKLPR